MVPTDQHYRMPVILSKAGVLPPFSCIVASGIDECPEIPYRHRILAYVVRLRDPNATLGPLVIPPSFLRFRGPHQELPRRDQHQPHPDAVSHFDRHAQVFGPSLLMCFGFRCIKGSHGQRRGSRLTFFYLTRRAILY
jgi:hypothetical protein